MFPVSCRAVDWLQDNPKQCAALSVIFAVLGVASMVFAIEASNWISHSISFDSYTLSVGSLRNLSIGIAVPSVLLSGLFRIAGSKEFVGRDKNFFSEEGGFVGEESRAHSCASICAQEQYQKEDLSYQEASDLPMGSNKDPVDTINGPSRNGSLAIPKSDEEEKLGEEYVALFDRMRKCPRNRSTSEENLLELSNCSFHVKIDELVLKQYLLTMQRCSSSSN